MNAERKKGPKSRHSDVSRKKGKGGWDRGLQSGEGTRPSCSSAELNWRGMTSDGKGSGVISMKREGVRFEGDGYPLTGRQPNERRVLLTRLKRSSDCRFRGIAQLGKRYASTFGGGWGGGEFL